MEKRRKKQAVKKLLLLIAAGCVIMSSFSGCTSKGEDEPSKTEPNPVVLAPAATSADLYCLEFNSFSGVYVEDGKNERVDNVAAILLENRSDVFLDKATVTYTFGDKTATFVATGIPAGKKCWVMEAEKMEIDAGRSFEFEKCVSAFKEDAVEQTDLLSVTPEDNALTVKNISEKTLENVCVYYKNTFDDGNFFGGITYMMSFGTLEPGAALTKESAHYSESSEIVRFSYQEK